MVRIQNEKTEVNDLHMEHSCGTVLYTEQNGEKLYLLIETPDGRHIGFPKGHMEKGETEMETALRETWEETSIHAVIVSKYKRQIVYKMKNGHQKTVTYFPARYENETPAHNEGFEFHYFHLLPYEEAYEKLTFENTREVLKAVHTYLENQK